eukprot:CAMPEP_0204576164 /NCGR_PEP_ID=MMETSP0661-20131031/41617_1 /ASSEMBLY_ACC=CAM_ASM_000606 /TAXON_ID=109239 /ORGANISM="Alexandrium margalefi, Strain AMGDE01CS-322" /LENGTH=164 /DNA_ID=CAMNT_0051584887 /DNA_START=8 /DNA_END=499 /DNA_ORIENTATION=-
MTPPAMQGKISPCGSSSNGRPRASAPGLHPRAAERAWKKPAEGPGSPSLLLEAESLGLMQRAGAPEFHSGAAERTARRKPAEGPSPSSLLESPEPRPHVACWRSRVPLRDRQAHAGEAGRGPRLAKFVARAWDLDLMQGCHLHGTERSIPAYAAEKSAEGPTGR